MNTERDFLRKLEKAKTEDEKTWLTTKRLIDSLPEDMQTLVFSAAIPHWFDAKILRALHPELSRKIRWLYPKLQELPFVEPFEGRGHNIHELTRHLMLDYLWKKQRRTYRSLSQNLVKFHEDSMILAIKKIKQKIDETGKPTKKSVKELQRWVNKNQEIVNAISPSFKIEYIYHLIIAKPERGTDEFRNAGLQWHDKFDYSFTDLNTLIISIEEHISSGRVKGRALGWTNYFKGLIHYYRSDYPSAKMFFFNIISEKYSDKVLNANSYLRLGDTSVQLSELPEARSYYEEALSRCQAINDEIGEANCIHALGDIHRHLLNFSESRVLINKALSLFRLTKEEVGEANCLRALGYIHRDLSEPIEARARYEEALPIYRSAKEKFGEASSIEALGYVHIMLSELPEALARYEEALSIYRSIGDTANEADCLETLGNIYADLSNLPEALARYEETLSIYRSIGDTVNEADCLETLGNIYTDLSKLPEALARYEEAKATYNKIVELEPSNAKIYSKLGNLLRKLKHYNEAKDSFRKAIELDQSNFDYYNNLVQLIRFDLTEILEDTIPLLKRMIEIKPEDFEPYLALASIKKQLGKSISSKLIKKARQIIPEDDWYNIACLECISDNFDLAYEYLEKSTQRDRFNSAWAWQDPDLQWIRDNPRFTRIVGTKPK